MSDERQVGSQFRLRFVSPRVVTLASIALLIIFTISAPEDYKASRHGTESILPPQMIKLGKLASRGISFGLLFVYFVQLLPTKRLSQAVGATLPLLMFCGWIMASTVWSPLKSITLMQSISFVLLIALALAIGVSTKKEEDVNRILALASVLLLVAAVGLILLHFAAPRYGVLTKKSSGLFHSTVAGSSSSLAILILLLSRLMWDWGWTRKLLIPGLLAHGCVMLICGNRLSLGVTVALSTICICWLAPSHKVASLALGGGLLGTMGLMADPRLLMLRNTIAGAGTFLSQGQTSTQLREISGRAEMWNAIWNSYWESPWIGHGHFVTSRTGQLYVWYEWGNWTAHNFMMQLLTTTGVVGAALLLSGYLLLAYRVVKRQSQDRRLAVLLLVLTLWYFSWGLLNASYLGPIQPESVIFSIVVGFAVALAIQEGELLHGPQPRVSNT